MSDPFNVSKAKFNPTAVRRTGFNVHAFGKKPDAERITPKNHLSPAVAVAGAGGATYGATAIGVGRKERKGLVKEVRSNRGKQASNTKRINAAMREKSGVSKGSLKMPRVGGFKGKPVRITDVGTRQEKLNLHQDSRPIRTQKQSMFTPETKAWAGVGAAAGAVDGTRRSKKVRTTLKNDVKRSEKKLASQGKTMDKLGISKSAFGVDHG